MRNPQDTQAAFQVIQQLAALCATPGISETNLQMANGEITNLLAKVIKPAVTDLAASSVGLIVK